ncbi:MAG: hypothetical protein HY287_03665 [Planctomycetes bacterium]|nr:hypothetical protein [Planctomycetota bacterium]MBI3833409.1 hypothetical protein [Planctomycetota bacterium]
MSTKFQVVLTLVLISLGGSVARAQHGHDDKKGEEHGKPVAFAMPTTYRLAVREIGHRLHEISELIEDKKLDKVHVEADVIQKVAKQVGQLALKEGSGVPKDAAKDVNIAGKDLAAKFDAIDKAGDSGDLAGTKKIYEDMVKIAATLQKYAAPVTYGEAVEEIDHHLQEIGELIEAKKLQDVHEHADDLQKTAKMVGPLASKDGSGVPKEAVKDVTNAGDALAEKSEGIEKAGESGDLAGAKKNYEELVRVTVTLQKFVATVYQCPMKCEGEKTYDKPGKCPKCGMELKARK